MPKCPETPFDWPSQVRRKHRVDFSEGPLSAKRLLGVGSGGDRVGWGGEGRGGETRGLKS